MTLRNAFADLATEDDLEQVAYLLSAILARLPFVDPVTAGARVAIQGTVPVSGTIGQVTLVPTVTTVGSVTAVAGVTAIGGLLASADQYVQMQAPAAALRNRITF